MFSTLTNGEYQQLSADTLPLLMIAGLCLLLYSFTDRRVSTPFCQHTCAPTDDAHLWRFKSRHQAARAETELAHNSIQTQTATSKLHAVKTKEPLAAQAINLLQVLGCSHGTGSHPLARQARHPVRRSASNPPLQTAATQTHHSAHISNRR
jgi:hypothetical protein